MRTGNFEGSAIAGLQLVGRAVRWWQAWHGHHGYSLRAEGGSVPCNGRAVAQEVQVAPADEAMFDAF